jgi:N-acetylmuramoyl-L-alanine amidase
MKRAGGFFFLAVFSAVTAVQGHCFSIQGPEKTMEAPAYRIRGTEYLPLTLICDAYGIDWRWDSSSMSVDLNKGRTGIKMRVDEYRVCIDDAVNIQEKPVVMHKGAVCVPVEFLRTIFNRFYPGAPAALPVEAGRSAPPPSPAVSHYKIKKIVLDPGHGGYDPGAIGRDGIKEKYITLDIAKKVANLLEEEGITIVMTRDDDTFIPLWKRVDIANRSNAGLFVSIHANASVARRLKGFEVYHLSEDLDDSARAAAVAGEHAMKFGSDSIYRYTDTLNEILWDLELTENRRSAIALGNDVLDNIDVSKRDIKNARFFVLKGTRMPAILVEVGYISNSEECARLGSGEYRSQIAGKIARGIIGFRKSFEETDGFSN